MLSRFSLSRLLLLLLIATNSAGVRGEEVDGIAPRDRDGRRLNLDFEFGTLDDWTATGNAFDRQPIWGDTVRRRRQDMRAQLEGERWVGTYEVHGDEATGTLTSAPFPVSHPFASFRVGGGDRPGTRVEIVREDTGDVIFTGRGERRENMRPVIVELEGHIGKSIFVRIIDEETGGWGHINFDAFRFHSKRPEFPDWMFSDEGLPSVDRVEHAGLSPADAVKAMTVPEGFEVDLIAAEPRVHQPVAFTFDARGRLWVAEAHSYPERVGGLEGAWNAGRDRIVIFADTDFDGAYETQTVFAENLNLVSGIEVGFGGVWVGAAPYLLFLPDKDGDDKPDGPAEILLDGFDIRDTHETPNAFRWGPDGWLYGCHGVFNDSRVGKPGTPRKDRVRVNAGVWRYHPTRRVFEVFAWGTSNPWGIDWNDHGQAFMTACVVPHLYHVIQGARYQRQAGLHFGDAIYDDIKHIGDHVHFLGGNPHAGNNRSGAAGGGHAHCGAMVYLGDAFPAQYRNALFMNNIHGNRVNQDVLERRGSGYVGRHAEDLLLSNDRWHRGIALRTGPDGAVYLIDWYDKQACHHTDSNIWDRTNGRIYRVRYGDPRPVRLDLGRLPSIELARLQLFPNDWYVRQARRILQERVARGEDGAGIAAARSALESILSEHEDPTRKLRALWALHVTGGLDANVVSRALESEHEHVRAWAIQLLCETGTPSSALLERFAALSREDPSQVVRLYLSSALQRLPVGARWDIAAGLASHGDDANDHNLPLMIWYGIHELADEDRDRALALVANGEIPMLLSYMVRKIASRDAKESLVSLVGALGATRDPARQRTILDGIHQALRGRRRVDMPQTWAAVYESLSQAEDPVLRSRLDALAVIFGDSRALESSRRVALDPRAELDLRRDALSSLVEARAPQAAETARVLVRDEALRHDAIRALGTLGDADAPAAIFDAWPSFDQESRRLALSALASRVSWAKALLDAIEAKTIPASLLSADIVRQIRLLRDETIASRLEQVWGTVREVEEDAAQAIARVRALLRDGEAEGQKPDLPHGRAIFERTCAQCHTLFGAGAAVGPDLTGSNRADLDYILSNILDPSAVLANEYRPWVFILKDGRVVTGLITKEESAVLTVATTSGTERILVDDIAEREQSELSMMPEDLLSNFADKEVRDLIAYLASPMQVPVLATAENASSIFDGRTLARWRGNEKLWSVENGEIVGKSPGISRNEFLIGDLLVRDFRLTFEVRLEPNAGNSGVQFRSEALPRGDVRGYQADIGQGWWGKLYEEHGRELLWSESGEKHVRRGEWNRYEILAVGSRIRTRINGELCVDLDDKEGAREGIIALQLHSGGAMEVRFRRFELEIDPKLEGESAAGAKEDAASGG